MRPSHLVFEELDAKKRKISANLGIPRPFTTAYLSSAMLTDLSIRSAIDFDPAPFSPAVLMEALPLIVSGMRYGEAVVDLAMRLRRMSKKFFCEVCKADDGRVVGEPPVYLVAGTCMCRQHMDEAIEHVQGALETSGNEVEASGMCPIVFRNHFRMSVPRCQVTAEDLGLGLFRNVKLHEDSKQSYAAPTIEGLKSALEVTNALIAALHRPPVIKRSALASPQVAALSQSCR